MKTEELMLVTEWDKTFLQSDKVYHKKETFINRYGITLAADMYIPKDADQITCDCRQRVIWGSKRAVFWTLCADNG